MLFCSNFWGHDIHYHMACQCMTFCTHHIHEKPISAISNLIPSREWVGQFYTSFIPKKHCCWNILKWKLDLISIIPPVLWLRVILNFLNPPTLSWMMSFDIPGYPHRSQLIKRGNSCNISYGYIKTFCQKPITQYLKGSTFVIIGNKIPLHLIVAEWGHMVIKKWVNIGSGNGCVCWWHQAITWTNTDLPYVVSSDFHQRTISFETSQPSITKIGLTTIYLKVHSNHPGPNELRNHSADNAVIENKRHLHF